MVRLLLLYALVLDVGVIGLPLGFVPHVFFPDQTARSIGWAPGSPFQFEVGVHDGAWGVLGFLCIWIHGAFWLATGLGWSLFMLGATYGHIEQTLRAGDYAPYNFLTIFSDGFIALWLLLLLYLRRRGTQRKARRRSGPRRFTHAASERHQGVRWKRRSMKSPSASIACRHSCRRSRRRPVSPSTSSSSTPTSRCCFTADHVRCFRSYRRPWARSCRSSGCAGFPSAMSKPMNAAR